MLASTVPCCLGAPGLDATSNSSTTPGLARPSLPFTAEQRTGPTLFILKANDFLHVFADFSHHPDLRTPLILRRESLIWAVVRQMSQTFPSMGKKDR